MKKQPTSFNDDLNKRNEKCSNFHNKIFCLLLKFVHKWPWYVWLKQNFGEVYFSVFILALHVMKVNIISKVCVLLTIHHTYLNNIYLNLDMISRVFEQEV